MLRFLLDSSNLCCVAASDRGWRNTLRCALRCRIWCTYGDSPKLAASSEDMARSPSFAVSFFAPIIMTLTGTSPTTAILAMFCVGVNTCRNQLFFFVSCAEPKLGTEYSCGCACCTAGYSGTALNFASSSPAFFFAATVFAAASSSSAIGVFKNFGSMPCSL